MKNQSVDSAQLGDVLNKASFVLLFGVPALLAWFTISTVMLGAMPLLLIALVLYGNAPDIPHKLMVVGIGLAPVVFLLLYFGKDVEDWLQRDSKYDMNNVLYAVGAVEIAIFTSAHFWLI